MAFSAVASHIVKSREGVCNSDIAFEDKSLIDYLQHEWNSLHSAKAVSFILETYVCNAKESPYKELYREYLNCGKDSVVLLNRSKDVFDVFSTLTDFFCDWFKVPKGTIIHAKVLTTEKAYHKVTDFVGTSYSLSTFYLSNPCSVAHDMGDNGCLLVSPALFNVTGMKAYRGLRTRKDAIKYCGNIKRWSKENINEFAKWLGLKPFGVNAYVVMRPISKNFNEDKSGWMIIYENSSFGGKAGMMSIQKLFPTLVDVMEYLITNFTD